MTLFDSFDEPPASPSAMRGKLRNATALGAALVSTVGGVTVADAAEPAPVPASAAAPKVTEMTAEQINRQQLPFAERRASRTVLTYLDAEARRGRPTDATATRAVATPGGGQLVWTANQKIDKLGIVSNGDARGVGWVGSETETAAADTVLPTGMGMGALRDVNGMEKKTWGCQTWGSPDYELQNGNPVAGDSVTGCFEKFKTVELNDRYDGWIYNRWGIGDPIDGGLNTGGLLEITLRSKPWKGKEGNVAGLLGWQPGNGEAVCGGGSEVTVSGGSGTAKMPFQNCERMNITVDTNTKSMMSQWKSDHGASYTSKGTDHLMSLSTWAGQPLVMADYIWGEFCGAICALNKDRVYAWDPGF